MFLEKNTVTFNQTVANQSVDIETELSNNNINYQEASDEVVEIPFIRTLNASIDDSAVNEVTNDTQSIEIDGNRIISQINTPIQLNGISNDTPSGELDESTLTNLDNFITSSVYEGDRYQFTIYNNEEKTITYMKETVSGNAISDGSSEIVFQMNDESEIYAYEQTVTGESAIQGDNRVVITQMQAIENAFLNNSVPSDSTILKTKLAYRITLALDDITIYHPVWTLFIQANDGTTQRVFVDAINGSILTQ